MFYKIRSTNILYIKRNDSKMLERFVKHHKSRTPMKTSAAVSSMFCPCNSPVSICCLAPALLRGIRHTKTCTHTNTLHPTNTLRWASMRGCSNKHRGRAGTGFKKYQFFQRGRLLPNLTKGDLINPHECGECLWPSLHTNCCCLMHFHCEYNNGLNEVDYDLWAGIYITFN